MTAPLVGGCLWLLMQTMGTPWEIELDGAILFFEDTHYAAVLPRRPARPARARREARAGRGRRRRADGEVATRATCVPCPDWARSRTIEDVLEERLEPLGVPVLYGLPARTREAPRGASARRHLHARRRREARSRSTSRLFASSGVLPVLLVVDEEAAQRTA